jgi:hypothetical protein
MIPRSAGGRNRNPADPEEDWMCHELLPRGGRPAVQSSTPATEDRTMPSPFPGMDPYLEDPAHWPGFHRHLVATLHQLLLPGLVDRYRARLHARKYVVELPLFTSVQRDEHEEHAVEVRSRTDGKLVTLVEVPTPTNKTTAQGRAAYLADRAAAVADRAAVVEIDLLSGGQPLLTFDRTGLPVHHQAVTATRGATPDRYEIYTATVSRRLPKFKLPLAADDRDTVVDLQVAVSRAYDLGDFGRLIDYAQPLPAACGLPDDARQWAAALLAPRKPG